MYKKFVVNLIFPAIGLLRVWNVVVERDWRYIVLWTILPWVGYLRIRQSQAPGLDSAIGIGVAILLFVVPYLIVWIISSMRDARLIFPPDVTTGSISMLLLLKLSFIMPLWLLVSFFHMVGNVVISPLGVAYLIYLASVVAAISFFSVAFRSKRRLDMLVLLPLIGLQGIPYLYKRRYGTAMGLIFAGVAVVGLVIWAISLDPRAIQPTQRFFAQAVAYLAPSVYFGMWLWTIADLSEHKGFSEGPREQGSKWVSA